MPSGVPAPSGEQFEIAFGDQRAVVVEVGGALRAYAAAGKDVVDGYEFDEMATAGRCQVLIPWPNRLEDGTYEFDSGGLQVPLDEPEHSNAIHGLVRWNAWTASEREPHRVVMEHVLRPQPGYPFTLSISIEYALGDAGLRVETTATNGGSDTCPYGCGFHPYLTVGTTFVDRAILRAPGRTVLRCDERGIPTGSAPVDSTEYDFREPRQIGAMKLDHGFTDLDRDPDGIARVELRHPDEQHAVTLWVDQSYPFLQLFTGDLPDVDRRGLAVEPMTCPPNAFRSGESLIRLTPGESFTSVWGIRAETGQARRPR